MNKQELWLRIARSCVGYGEGADFDFKEMICYNFITEVETAYKVPYPAEENFEDSDEGYKKYQQAFKKWEKTVEQLQQDVLNYLGLLIEERRET